MRGLGDRWLAGEPVDGVAFAHHDSVEVVGGSLDGHAGTVLLLLAVAPEPLYLVAVDGRGDVRIRQSALQAAPRAS